VANSLEGILSANASNITFVHALRERAIVGFGVTILGASLGAAALLKHVPEVAVYAGAFGFAFVFTLASRFASTTKRVVAWREAKAQSNISVEANPQRSIYTVVQLVYQVLLVAIWAGAAVMLHRGLLTGFPLDGFSLFAFRVLEAMLQLAALWAVLGSLFWSRGSEKTKTKDRGR
jgi:hypothetical protein